MNNEAFFVIPFKIKLTEFALRHFDQKFGGTKVLDKTPEEFENQILFEIQYARHGSHPSINVVDGYAPFCKLVPIKNFTDARVGALPITLENYQYIRSGYSARRDSELPVFSRWLDLPLGRPTAKYLMLVIYSKEQLHKEHDEAPETKGTPFTFDADWGIVAILGQNHEQEEPMKPETMLRNALGTTEGGSGVPLNREQYLRSVDFWDKHATVK